jgi:hypothetical protein
VLSVDTDEVSLVSKASVVSLVSKASVLLELRWLRSLELEELDELDLLELDLLLTKLANVLSELSVPRTSPELVDVGLDETVESVDWVSPSIVELDETLLKLE